MKTKQQAANEECFHGGSKRDFIAGIEFAQRWISVKDELPQNHSEIFFKTDKGFIYSGRYAECQFMTEVFESITGVKFWRLIEFE